LAVSLQQIKDMANFITRISDSIFKRSAPSSLTNPSEWLYTLLGGSKTHAGVTINQETALAHAAVFACSKVLSESIASLPLELFQYQDDETTKLTNDSRYILLNAEPSELYTSYDFRATAMLHVCLHGNFYASIVRDGNRRPAELRIIDPATVTPYIANDGNLYYKIANVSTPKKPSEILHVKGLSTDGIIGRSPIQIFRENIGLGIATIETQGSLWKNGMLSMGYLKHPLKMTSEQVIDIRENFRLNYSGKENAGKMPVLQGGMEYIPLTLKPSDAMFIETAKLSRQDICSIYRVPPHMIGDLERSTNNNIEHQSLEFVRDTLRPILKSWEQELNRKLLFQSEKTTRFFRFNVDALLRGDTQSRGEYFTRALGGVSNPAWMTQNEIRAIDNLNPIEGGDILYSPSMNGQGAQPIPSEIPATTDTNGNDNNDSNNDSNNQPNDSQNGTNI
jgi:HK97 family phage portal protein